MKKFLYLFLLSIVCSTPGFSQQGFHVGLGGNFNTVWIVNQNAYGLKEYDYQLDLGGGGGIVLGYNISDHFGFQAEIKSSKQGQKYVEHNNSSLTRDVKLNYVAIPVLLKVIGGSSNVRFYSNAGIQYNILTDATLEGYYYLPQPMNIPASERFNSTDLGVNFGLGGDVFFTDNLYMNVGMSFYYSLTDINAKSGTGIFAYQGKTWQWPDNHGAGVYKASRNGTGGFSLGLHYLFSSY